MSEQFNEQISEFIDDELSAEECEFFVRRLQRDEESRRRYARYQLFGAAVRGEHLRVVEARAPATAAPETGVRPLFRASRKGGLTPLPSPARWAAGAGIAASVAVAAVLGLRVASLDTTLADEATAALDTPSYVVPTSSADTRQIVSVPVQLTELQYLMHHSGFTSGLNRNLMHSNVVAGQETITDETVDEAFADGADASADQETPER